MISLREDIQNAINRHCAENGSNTPDFILASYLIDCLTVFDRAVTARQKWLTTPLRTSFITEFACPACGSPVNRHGETCPDCLLRAHQETPP